MIRRALPWALPAVVLTGVWILLLWLSRPTWAYCVDGPDPSTSGCESGTLSLAAVVGTVLLAALLVGYLVLALVVRGPRRRVVLGIGFAVLVAGMLWASAMQNVFPIERGP